MCLNPIKIRVKRKPIFGETEPYSDGFIHLVKIPVMDYYTVSCGKCLDCLKQKSIEWAFRIMDEAKQYKDNCFITLTYNNDYLPSDRSVSKRDLQLFMKRFRKSISPLTVRFFACGEYGKQRSRPHYHIIIFGWKPSDIFFWQKDKSGCELFRSPHIEKCWSFGFSSVGNLSYDTALYCAKYMQKAQFVKRKGDPSFELAPPFIQMSNRPGIGYNAVYKADLLSDRIYCNGRSCKIPRYYLKVMERDGVFLDDFKNRRQRQGKLVSSLTDLNAKRDKYKLVLKKNLVKK